MDFIFVERWGGLGNQLFQYTAALTVAIRHQCPLYFSKELMNTHNTLQNNYAALFEYGHESENLATHILTIPGFTMFTRLSFHPWTPEEVPRQSVLLGYFQYYPAIKDTIPLVCESLCRKLSERRSAAFLKYGVGATDIFIHIRRGDYLDNPEVHYLQGREYYETAYRLLTEKLGYQPTHAFILSDDIEWCRGQDWLMALPGATLVDEPNELDALALMSLIKAGAIIANSTFSWWGAIFNPSAVVIYPKRWMFSQIFDLFPPQWHGL
jgi:hypothetical protein